MKIVSSVLTISLTMICITSCNDSPSVQPFRAVTRPIPMMAHRGAGLTRPENTVDSYVHSWELGLAPEADIRQTKDGHLVCFHDDNFARLASNVKPEHKLLGVDKLAISEVKKLEVGSYLSPKFHGQRIPSLVQVFEEMRGNSERYIYLDIKQVNLNVMADLVKHYELTDQVIFSAGQYVNIRLWNDIMPTSLTLLWINGNQAALDRKLKKLKEQSFHGITHLQMNVSSIDDKDNDKSSISSEFLQYADEMLKSYGVTLQVFPWESSKLKDFIKLQEIGINGIGTDYPETTLKAIRKYQHTIAPVEPDEIVEE